MGSGCSIDANHRQPGLSSTTVSPTQSSADMGVCPPSCTTDESQEPMSDAAHSLAAGPPAAFEGLHPPPHGKQNRFASSSYKLDPVSSANPRSCSILPPPPPYVPITRKTDTGDGPLLKHDDHGSLISADGVMFSNVKRSSPHLSHGPTPPMEEPLGLPRTSDSDTPMDAMRQLDVADGNAGHNGSIRTPNSAFNSSDDCTSLVEGKRCLRGDYPAEFPAQVHRDVSPAAEEVANGSQVSPYSETASVPERLLMLSTTQF